MSGMKLIGGETNPAMTNEQVYDEVSYIYKEWVGFPNRYFDLTNDQKFFIDNLFQCCYNTVMINPEVREETNNLRELADEMQASVNNIKNLLG